MSHVLILKLNAAGDVVRTTPLLRRLDGDVTWITHRNNVVLVDDVHPHGRCRCLSWEQRDRARDADYDLVINLEDEREQASFVDEVRHRQRFGAYLAGDGSLTYTEDSRGWFDLSLISRHGRTTADALKLKNRRCYQDLVFEGLGYRFDCETYLLPPPTPTDLSGDVAIAPVAGPVWPMKNWAGYDRLQLELRALGLRVNVLPRRASLRQHIADIAQHACLVGGDSLPMHLALGTGTPGVTLFTCTSPWEIHDYGIQTKIVSPVLERFFYQRHFDEAAVSAITVDRVYAAVVDRLAARVEVAAAPQDRPN